MKNLILYLTIIMVVFSCKDKGTPPTHFPVQVVLMEGTNEENALISDLHKLNSIIILEEKCKNSGSVISDLTLFYPDSKKAVDIKINVNKDGWFDRSNTPIRTPKVLKNVIDAFYETYSLPETDSQRKEHDFTALLNKSQLKGKVTLVYNQTGEFDSICIGDIMYTVHKSLDSIRSEIQKAFCDDKTTSFCLVYNPIMENYGGCKFKDDVVITIFPPDEEDIPDTEETTTTRRKSGGKKKYVPKQNEPVRVPPNGTQNQGKSSDLSKVKKTDIQNNTISGKDTKSNNY
ncbi:MAG: hypothetical protein KA536_11470 [Saprospiraceae bacterium]|nr:hypothetical protein [Saprospiraceae bacterium]